MIKNVFQNGLFGGGGRAVAFGLVLVTGIGEVAVAADLRTDGVQPVIEVPFHLESISYTPDPDYSIEGRFTMTVANATVNDRQPMEAGDPGKVPDPPRMGPTGMARMVPGVAYPLSSSEYQLYTGDLVFDLSSCYMLVIDDGTGYPWYVYGGEHIDVQHGSWNTTLTLEENAWMLFETGPGVCRDCAANTPNPSIVADGHSQAIASVLDATGPFAWGIEGDNLGCKIEAIENGSRGLITAGYKAGDIIVTATANGCVIKGVLSLVCGEQGSGCAGDACRGLGSGAPAGSGLDFRWGLGSDSFDRHGGFIRLSAASSSTTLASPKALRLLNPSLTAESVWESNVLRQVKTPLGLVDIVTTATNQSGQGIEYRLKQYSGTSFSMSSGVYVPGQGVNPFGTWIVKNPDSTGATYNQLWIIEDRGGLQRTNKYTYSSSELKWTLDQDQALAQVVTWTTNVSSTRYEYREVRQGANLLSKVRKKYEPVNGRDELKETLEGDGSITRTTTYTYYDGTASSEDRYRLKQIDYPDGSWVIYDYETKGRLSKVYSAYGDQAPTTVEANCKVTEYAYSLTAGTDGVDNTDAVDPLHPRRTITKIKGSEVSRSYATLVDGETIEKACPTPGALWTATDNLITTTRYFTSPTYTDWFTNRVREVAFPNGTKAMYSYDRTSTTQTTTIEQGEPDGSGISILNGTETVTVVDSTGNPISRTVKAIVNGTAGVKLSEDIYTYLDELKQSYEIASLGGRVSEVMYACCGLDSETDWDGTTTSYQYDGLKREVASTRLGVTATNIFDGAGRVLVKKRIGSDQTIVTQEQNAYDVLGRVTSSTNALNGITTFAEAIVSSKLQRTTTYPDGGTRIETYYRDGRLEKVTGTSVQPVRYFYDKEQDGGAYREYSKEIKLDASGNDTSEWTKTYTDGAGRAYKTIYAAAAGAPYRESVFNTKGQLFKERDPDNVCRLFAYDGQGRLVRTAVDLNQNSQIDPTDGNGGQDDDRISDTVQDVLASGAPGNSRGTDIRRSRTFVFTTNDATTTNLVSMTESSTDGLRSWQTAYRDQSTPVTTSRQTTYGANGARTETVTEPNGASVESVYSYGRLLTVTRKNSAGGQVSQTGYAYDPHGRISSTTDARNGATSFSFNSADQTVTVTTPLPGTGEAPQVITTFYDNLMRQTGQLLPDGSTTTNLYFQTGLLKKTWGSRLYPVEYTYDPQGRMKTMKTWQNFAGDSGTAITTWNYDPYRGWLNSKYYPNATTGAAGTAGPSYTYKDSGRMLTRLWERGVTTTYAYNNAGDLNSVTYSDGSVSTPSTTYTFDRRGRRLTAARNSITATFTYNDAGGVLTESYAGGTLAGFSVNRTFNTLLQRDTVNFKNGSTVQQGVSFGYDNAGRLSTVTDSQATGHSAAYAYDPDSMLIKTLAFTNNASSVGSVTSRAYDKLNRLTSISSKPYGASSPSLPVGFAYQYNPANQRTRATLADGSFWVYQYDPLGQVTSGQRFWGDGTPVDGQQFNYAFDDIGNRTTTGGRASAVSTYTRNYRNQYTQRTVAGAVDILGLANPTAGVTVNGSTANRKGEYFHWPLSVSNGSAQYPTVTTISQYGAGQTTTGKVFVPATPEACGYDADGNLSSDGRWTYSWDGENRLVEMKRDVDSPTGARQKLAFEYDFQGRRIRKQYFTYSGGWVEQSDVVYLYDGWNLLGEVDANASNAKLRTYLWGLDLSGSEQGAGGVGGLLQVTDWQGTTTRHWVAYDGNGNVAALVAAADGSLSARYEYGPFAEPLRTTSTGTMAKRNPFRFSTKYTDDQSGLVYYGYRYYNPTMGRWISRDPIAEKGGKDLYCILGNTPVGAVDLLGAVYEGAFVVKLSAVEYRGETYLGFQSSYYTGLVGTTCPCGSQDLFLIQAVLEPKPYGTGVAKIDTLLRPLPKKPPGYYETPDLPIGNGPLTIVDAPMIQNSEMNGGTWTFEDCAVCRVPGKEDRVLGCVRFTFTRVGGGGPISLSVEGGHAAEDDPNDFFVFERPPSDLYLTAVRLYPQQK